MAITERSHARVRTTVVALALLCLSAGALAQEPKKPRQPEKDYALIFGTVWTADNRPAYGVPVKIRRANEKKARWDLMSDHSGEFAQRVPPGAQDYVIWADIKVPKGQPKPFTTVHVDNNERVDVVLHLTEQPKPGAKK